MKKVYVSCPLVVEERKLETTVNLLASKGIHAKFWVRGSVYSNHDLVTSDAVVFILPDNKWGMTRRHLSTGIMKELDLAVKLEKNIFMVYVNGTRVLNIYAAEVTSDIIKGIPGTTRNIFEYMKESTNINNDGSINEERRFKNSMSIVRDSGKTSQVLRKEGIEMFLDIDKAARWHSYIGDSISDGNMGVLTVDVIHNRYNHKSNIDVMYDRRLLL